MQNNCTPAPWQAKGDVVFGPGGIVVAECCGYSVRATAAEQRAQGGREANAQLIAAAPEMRDALKAMVITAQGEGLTQDPAWHELVDIALAVLAKASL